MSNRTHNLTTGTGGDCDRTSITDADLDRLRLLDSLESGVPCQSFSIEASLARPRRLRAIAIPSSVSTGDDA